LTKASSFADTLFTGEIVDESLSKSAIRSSEKLHNTVITADSDFKAVQPLFDVPGILDSERFSDNKQSIIVLVKTVTNSRFASATAGGRTVVSQDTPVTPRHLSVVATNVTLELLEDLFGPLGAFNLRTVEERNPLEVIETLEQKRPHFLNDKLSCTTGTVTLSQEVSSHLPQLFLCGNAIPIKLSGIKT